MKISFEDVIKSSCKSSHEFLRRSRHKGIRKTLRILFNKRNRSKWVSKSPGVHFIYFSQRFYRIHVGVCKPIWDLFLVKSYDFTVDDIIAILDKHEIDDQFSDVSSLQRNTEKHLWYGDEPRLV